MNRTFARLLLAAAFLSVPFMAARAQSPAAALPSPNANATPEETAADQAFTARDWPAAIKLYEAITKSSPANARAWFQLGASLHEAGDFARAAEVHLQAAQRGMTPPQLPNFRAVRAYARAGNPDKAFALLDTMLTAGFANSQSIETSPDLASLRTDARYEAAVRRARVNADPCNNAPGYRVMDFWVGTWEVQSTGTAAGTPGGATNVIEKILNGCALLENWAPPAAFGHGKGLHMFNATSGNWQQNWVTATGAVVNFVGEFKDGKMHYTTEGTMPNGTKFTRVTHIYPINKDTVRQHGEASTDGGKTWTPTFDLTYYRKAT